MLMVAEKPSLARSLAVLLAEGRTVNTRPSKSSSCPVHEFDGTVFGRRQRVRLPFLEGAVGRCQCAEPADTERVVSTLLCCGLSLCFLSLSLSPSFFRVPRARPLQGHCHIPVALLLSPVSPRHF